VGKERDPSNFEELRDFKIQEKREETIPPTRGGGSAHPGPLQNIIPIFRAERIPVFSWLFLFIDQKMETTVFDFGL